MAQNTAHANRTKGPAHDMLTAISDRDSKVMGSSNNALELRVAELERELQVERAQNQSQRALEEVAAEARSIRAGFAAARPAHRPVKPTGGPEVEEVAMNLPLDTEWAQLDDRFREVVHVFHQGWHGIRAAVGFQPGQKLMIPANREMTPDELRRAISRCSAAQVVVFQGFSKHAELLLTLLRKHCDSSLRIYAIWHGSTAQFHSSFEQVYFSKLVTYKKKGTLNGFGSVKPDMHLLSPHVHAKTLINIAPRVAKPFARPSGPTGKVLVPVRNNFWKNFYTNVYAASTHPRVKQVLVTSEYVRQDALAIGSNVVEVGEPGRTELLRIVSGCDLVLNVTLTDCQPMTAVEALAVNVPCLTGALAVPELSEHPYQKLMTVIGSDLIGRIRDGVDRVLNMRHSDPAQLDGLLADYQRVIRETGLNRLAEFLHL